MEPLHIVNQVAPREYVNFTLCFPFENDRAQEAVAHLQQCVDACIQQNPHLAGALRVQNTPQRNTLAYVHAPPGGQHRVGVQQLRPTSFSSARGSRTAFTYDELRAGGFSPGLFFDDVFVPAGNPAIVDGDGDGDGEGEGSVPVMRVHAIFIPGGLLLGVFIHHAMSDGVVATALIDDLAARSRGEMILPKQGRLPKSQYLPLGRPSSEFEQRVRCLRETNGLSNEEILAEMLPEWTTADPNRGPDFGIKNCLPANRSPRDGKIFHFSKARLAELSGAIARAGDGEGSIIKRPSTSVALMVLIWAYVAKARMRAAGVGDWLDLLKREKKNDNGNDDKNKGRNMAAQLLIVADWKPSFVSSVSSSTENKTGGGGGGRGGRGGGFGQETLDAIEDFCGNTIKCPIAILPSTQLLWQAASSSSSSITQEDSDTTKEDADTVEAAGPQKQELAELAAIIARPLDSMNAEFVRRRAALLETVSDITAMAMDHDFEAPQNLLFNSHRFLAGADTVWDIPGLLADKDNSSEGVVGGGDPAAVSSSGSSSTRRKPEIIRKGRKLWGQGTVLVMPSSRESDVLEVMLAMSGTAMEELCKDAAWRDWVEKIVD
ncbi:hypothetical protein PG994_002858 [Apiospora phragmitis]|uniref:Trichothecene 3-O-acetyltransferase-like N-terminal domain-containing protein n=1 Tax=Apiospora phragmitis TaxID=2905665 RepID=A0ABR1W6B7_9PEZI